MPLADARQGFEAMLGRRRRRQDRVHGLSAGAGLDRHASRSRSSSVRTPSAFSAALACSRLVGVVERRGQPAGGAQGHAHVEVEGQAAAAGQLSVRAPPRIVA